MIVHDELDKAGKDVRIERTRSDAITHQKSYAFRAAGYVYATNQMALDDYLTIHWAWEEDAPSSHVSS